jgi:hypothetical protein
MPRDVILRAAQNLGPVRPHVIPRLRLGMTAACMLAFAAEASGQSVLLQLRPKVGDTLVMRLEQESQLTSQRTDGGAISTMTTRMTVFSRAIVEASTPTATNLLAVTDSVLVATMDAAPKRAAPAQRLLQGQQLRVRISPDGSPAMADDERRAPRSVSDAMSMIPATFPREAVAVGDTWVREVALPGSTGPFGAALAGRLRATFRLDSISRGGSASYAYVSMRGELEPGDTTRVATGSRLDDGTVTGMMIIDRARGWLAESRFTILARSSVMRSALGAPMRVTMRVHQRLRTFRR